MSRTIIMTAGILLIISAAVLFAAEQKQGPRLTFATEGYDCGIIYFEDVDIKTIEIEFSNTGDAPLLLGDVQACCGTFVSYWPRRPVLPGETSRIMVRFRVAARPHKIRRVVSVESNSADRTRKRFHITGQVEQRAE